MSTERRVTPEPARPEDVPALIALVDELAEYEHRRSEVTIEPADLREALFGPKPLVEAVIARASDGQAVGFAIWFYTFSTFLGRHGIWLEDLFVRPDMRGHGIGKALLVNLAQRCVREGLGRFEWAVLDWNRPSIDFYTRQGASFMDDWRRCRVDGAALAKLGAS